MGSNRIKGTLAIGLVAALAGCADSGAPAVRQKQLITGRSANPNGQTGSSVDAFELDGTGHAVAASNPSTTGSIDAEGKFSIEVDVVSGTLTDVLVESSGSGKRQACIVESFFDSPSSNVAEPFTDETTFESDVFTKQLQQGMLFDGCFASLVQDWAGSNAAGAHSAGGSTPDSLAQSAEVIAAATDAFHSAMSKLDGSSPDAMQQAFVDHVNAARERAAALDASSTQQQIDDAKKQYEDALKSAYASHGFDPSEQATAAQCGAEAAQAKLNSLPMIDATLQAALAADAELERAESVIAAIDAESADAGASQSSLTAAADALKAALASAASMGAANQSQIDGAWRSYADSVESALRSGLTPPQGLAFDGVVTTLKTGASNLQSTLASSFGQQPNFDSWVAPIVSFCGSGGSESNALTSSGLSNTQSTAIVKILLQIELAAS